jgi:hypothetical protein
MREEDGNNQYERRIHKDRDRRISVFSDCTSAWYHADDDSLDADATRFHSHEARASASEEFPPPKHGYEIEID